MGKLWVGKELKPPHTIWKIEHYGMLLYVWVCVCLKSGKCHWANTIRVSGVVCALLEYATKCFCCKGLFHLIYYIYIGIGVVDVPRVDLRNLYMKSVSVVVCVCVSDCAWMKYNVCVHQSVPQGRSALRLFTTNYWMIMWAIKYDAGNLYHSSPLIFLVWSIKRWECAFDCSFKWPWGDINYAHRYRCNLM